MSLHHATNYTYSSKTVSFKLVTNICLTLINAEKKTLEEAKDQILHLHVIHLLE